MPDKPHLPEGELLSRIRQLIQEGRLPLFLSGDVMAGYGGRGDVCSACDKEILAEHVVYEVTDSRGGAKMAFHVSCHTVWQLECARLVAEKNHAEAGDRSDPNLDLPGQSVRL
jgi:hypothetical protein